MHGNMNHQEMNHKKHEAYSVKNFLPLIVLGILIVSFVTIKQIAYGFDTHNAMYDFMGAFFIIFSVFKIINLRGFADAFSTYDILAKRYRAYAYAYPFIELSLGILYLARLQLLLAHWITLILMIISSIGVARELMQKRQIVCACLGAVFKIPMTYVTLAEDVIMGLMALIMLAQHYFL